ncbi:anti-sigma factor [Oceanobacillus iheyensis]|uniref:anti-sigma factor n=1 Tax=Oceanobacillus iheyensis TaxID=182710 RepID=UPI00363D1A4C
MKEWNKDMEKKILKKYRFTLQFRVLRIILAVIFIYILYMTVINIAADRLHITNKNMYFSMLALEWTTPNSTGSVTNQSEMTIFGTNKITYPISKRIGTEQQFIGEAEVHKTFMSYFSSINYSQINSEELSPFDFYLPEDPNTNKPVTGTNNENVWNSLEQLPEGTVGELAFSTDEYMSPEELQSKLQDIDIKLLWMPLYTGEFITYEPESWSTSNKQVAITDRLGLTPGIEHSKDYLLSTRNDELSDVEQSQNIMLKNMEDLLDQSESYYTNFLDLKHLQTQYQYIIDEGFVTYGAVVTGPVKELERLEDLPFIQNEELGAVELWNWDK